jgi:hypothetical protein
MSQLSHASAMASVGARAPPPDSRISATNVPPSTLASLPSMSAPIVHNGEHDMVSPLPSKIHVNSGKKYISTVDMYSKINNKLLIHMSVCKCVAKLKQCS